MQTTLYIDDQNKNKNGEYIQPPQQKGYKEKNTYKDRRKNQQTNLVKFDQRILTYPLVWSNDRMSIKTPKEPILIDINKTYGQDWKSYNQAQTQEKILFLEMLHELTCLVPPQKYKGTGRPPMDRGEMIFSMCLKIYLDFSSRRTASDIRLAQQLGYLEHTPHFNTILKYINKPEMKEILKALIDLSSMPLKHVESGFAIDASGFSTSMFSRWFSLKQKKEDRRLFKKAHITCGIKTNIIANIEVTDGYTHDSTMFRSLVENTFKRFEMKEVYADKGYSSRENLGIVDKCGAIPFIPFKKNATKKTKGVLIWSTMYNYFKYNKPEFMKHYHKRSNVESIFSMIKRKQGDHLLMKNDYAQVNEVLVKALVHNICVLIQEMFEIGIRVEYKEDEIEEFMCKIKML